MNARILGLSISPLVAGVATLLVSASPPVYTKNPLHGSLADWLSGNASGHSIGAFRAFADSLELTATPPTSPQSHPEDSGVCNPGKSSAQVTVTAIKDSHVLAHHGTYRKPGQSFTYVLARIDVADCNLTKFGVTRGHRAYWVVEPDEYLILRSHFVDVGLSSPPSGSPPYQEGDLAAASRWSYAECPQSHTKLKDDQAALISRRLVCSVHDNDRVRQASTEREAALAARALLPVKLDSGDDLFLWIVCADGCCYATS